MDQYWHVIINSSPTQVYLLWGVTNAKCCHASTIILSHRIISPVLHLVISAPLLHPVPTSTTHLFTVYPFVPSRKSWGWTHTVCNLSDGLLSLSNRQLGFLHVFFMAWRLISLHHWIIFHTFFIHLLSEAHRGCSQFKATLKCFPATAMGGCKMLPPKGADSAWGETWEQVLLFREQTLCCQFPAQSNPHLGR